ncbi:mitogen-activated protein kinase kinase kinase 3-like [Typha latifolia]|uniref:mitogen-activated protein kinase kinase kinase 3-like n=1 Tax=Typha latifolia TaxID=4733 RepID=UPI003C2DED10
MPSWWKRKSKSSSKTKAEEETVTPRHGKEVWKEKASSFDENLVHRKSRDPSPIFAGRGGGLPGPAFVHGHPLPRPSSVSSPLPTIPHENATTAATAGSASGSVSSSGSSEEMVDFGFHRYSETINMPRGRNLQSDPQKIHRIAEAFLCNPILPLSRCPEVSTYPRKDIQVHGFGPSTSGTTCCNGHPSKETTVSPRATCISPGSREQHFPSSPVRPREFSLCPPGSPTRRQDGMRSPPHPLPFPPSSSSCSLQSQWKKGKLLGRGTFGHVYLGFNSESGQMCAIKEVNVISDDANSKECLKQLSQEITLLSHLSHPNIVRYHGSELVDGALSVYLEYVSGGSIHKLLQEYGPFREPVIRNYTFQILSGLAYLHGRNTVHRDIKGANILVDPTGEIKLADFGMAKHITSYSSIRSFKGSPYWMAPEVIMNASGYNLSVDIWSLGCTILEMATSKPPWSQFEGVAAIFKIGNSKDIPEIPDHLSAEGKNFLKLCLQRDPAARPTAAQLMDHSFVRDQAAIKSTKSMSNADLSINRSISPLREREIGTRDLSRFPSSLISTHRNPNHQMNMRANLSLPVSPCSSPTRQFGQSNWSCLPSPPHPAYSAGAINYSPINYALYPMRPSNTSADPRLEIAQLRAQSPYGSPRRL